jgi:uncharacterized repeat protein (TIGR01451 family)
MMPAAAWQRDNWVEGGDGFMVNNVIIDTTSISVSTNENNTTTGSVSVTAYEWRNDRWERINGTSLRLNQTMNFTAADGNYSVKVIDFREVGRFNEVRLEVWTSANVTNSGVIKGGHANATGAGRPDLVVTRVLSPSGDISVGDVVTVTVHIENRGRYEARNVTINDPAPEGFVISNVSINNTINQTVNPNSNNTYRSYQIRAIDPGSVQWQGVNVTAENALGIRFNYNSPNTTIVVSDLAALTFTPQGPNGNRVDYHTRSSINGSITIRNTGTLPAQHISIDFGLPNNATISGRDINSTTGTVYIDQIMPNNQRVIEYSLSATAEGFFEVPITYSYVYNGSNKSGTIQTVTYSAVGNTTIATALQYWFVLLIPVILIAAVAFFLWRRHREYKF